MPLSFFPPPSCHDPPARDDPDRGDPDGPGLLRVLRHSLDHALTALGETRDEHSFTTERADPPGGDPPPASTREAVRPSGIPPRTRRWARTYKVKGPASFSARVRVTTSRPPGEGPVRVCVGLEEGPAVRYTVRCPAAPEDTGEPRASEAPARPDPVAALSRKVTAFLFHELEHRFEALETESARGSTASAPSPTLARLALTREMEIGDLTPRARALLGYGEQERVDPNFFTYVDGHNLRRVMCDLAEMVEGQKQRARWLLRLRGGERRWRWFRGAVQNRLDARGTIEVTLRPLGTWPSQANA